ncbi:ScbA/BarX family gamma-butyrolactone biosynthesis protein [Streptomyces sp. NPDC093225]|uniref:ScbA/BarX family gamma-butyrolactone biosynthesis protein n=1 Tax=Streptomyces sp. NPDC093225 TaxID=3366034 RepID=UPI00380EF198
MLIIDERPEAPASGALTTTVAKEYVHRAALSDVFLTDCAASGPDSFVIGAQWPRLHGFYQADHGLYDPLLLCETIRQTLPLLIHTQYGVPFGHQLMWSHLHYAVNPQAMPVGRTPADLRLHVTCTDATYRRGLPAALSLRYEITRGDDLLAVASTDFSCHTPAVYRRLRAGRDSIKAAFWDIPRPPLPVLPEHCARERAQDVVLAPGDRAGRWRLRVDTAHPVLFDHPVDHAPGMLLLEAARQAGYAARPGDAAARWPASMDVAFRKYVEFDQPCWIEARPAAATGTVGAVGSAGSPGSAGPAGPAGTSEPPGATSGGPGHPAEPADPTEPAEAVRVTAVQGDGTAFEALVGLRDVSGLA